MRVFWRKGFYSLFIFVFSLDTFLTHFLWSLWLWLLFHFLHIFHTISMGVLSLSDRYSLQVSKTLLGILTNLNAGFYMVSILPLISNSLGLFSKLLGPTPSAPSIIGITVTFMFHRYFCNLARSKYLFLFLYSFMLKLWSVGTSKSTWWQVLFLLIVSTRFGLLARIGQSGLFAGIGYFDLLAGIGWSGLLAWIRRCGLRVGNGRCGFLTGIGQSAWLGDVAFWLGLGDLLISWYFVNAQIVQVLRISCSKCRYVLD